MDWRGRLQDSIKYHDWIPVRSPGLQFYADEIRSGKPFTFVRYGEGEWRFIVPALPEKTGRDGTWRDKALQDDLRHTVTDCIDHARYWPAIWHLDYLVEQAWFADTAAWLEQYSWIRWHDGRVWRRAYEQGHMGKIVCAMRDQALPIVIVGPHPLDKLARVLNAKMIRVHRREAHLQREEVRDKLLRLGPSLISFSMGCTAKMLIHELFPKIGEHSYMIDFGAIWDGMCGHKSRRYHSDALEEANWSSS